MILIYKKKQFFITLVVYLMTTYSIAQPIIIAHRGASAYKIENSISAFEAAIHMKADYIETDVHQTADGVVVIMHDETIDRMCSTAQKQAKKTLVKELSSQDFSTLTFKNSTEKPPTLDSAIKFINGRCKLLIEIKKGSDYYPNIEKNILAIIKANNAEAWIDIIHSFDSKPLIELQKTPNTISLQKLIVFKFPFLSITYAKQFKKDDFKTWTGVNVFHKFLSKHLIKKLHAQHKSVFAWTVNNERKAKKLIKAGIDGIITNKPDMMKALVLNK